MGADCGNADTAGLPRLGELRLPAVREKIAAASACLKVVPGREYDADIRAEAEKWGKLVGAPNPKSEV